MITLHEQLYGVEGLRYKNNFRLAFEKYFNRQRRTAKSRGILFLLSYEEWLNIWIKSKHFAERGTKKGQYVMARFGDKGNYEIGNVKIITVGENVRESKLGKTWSLEARQKISFSRLAKHHHHTKEAKEKISKGNLGNQNWLGKKHSVTTIIKMRLAQQRRYSSKRKEVSIIK